MKIANPYETCKPPRSLLMDSSKISCPESFFSMIMKQFILCTQGCKILLIGRRVVGSFSVFEWADCVTAQGETIASVIVKQVKRV